MRAKDREHEKMKAFRDKETSRERLRNHRFIDKGRDIMTIIQDDELSSKMITNQSGMKNNNSLYTSKSFECFGAFGDNRESN